MKKRDERLAGLIDHTILRSNATVGDVKKLCREAIEYRFASAVVSPYYVPLASEVLGGSGIPLCSVVSFPLGTQAPGEKAREAEYLMRLGAGEIDAVMNVGAFLSGRFDVVEEEFRLIASICKERAVSKIIIETACLGREEILRAAGMSVEAGFDFIKTSTGYAARGVSVEDVTLIRSVTGNRAGIKASGGIRTREFALELIDAGASRLGCSQSIALVALGD